MEPTSNESGTTFDITSRPSSPIPNLTNFKVQITNDNNIDNSINFHPPAAPRKQQTRTLTPIDPRIIHKLF